MTRRDDDHIGHTPKMTPAHDEIASFQRTKAKGALAASLGEVPSIQSAGSSTGSKSLLTAIVLILLATAAWAGYLHLQLQAADQSIKNYEVRIGDLEKRLMVTDESVNESSVATKVKIREMDSEIRKLWDNVWKKSKQQFAEHEALLNKHTQSLKNSEAFITSTKQQLSKNNSVVAGLSQQLKQAEQLQSQVLASKQALAQLERNLETVADKANSAGAALIKMDRRVKSTEEWVESINGFRRQVNRDINALKQGGGQVQSTTP